MNELQIQGVVLIAMMTSLPLTAIGTATDTVWLYVSGLVVMGVSGAVPPVLRWVDADDDDE